MSHVSQPTQPEQTQGAPVQAAPDAALPAPTTHRLDLGGQVPADREDQRPGVLRGGRREVAGAAHIDAAIGPCVKHQAP